MRPYRPENENEWSLFLTLFCQCCARGLECSILRFARDTDNAYPLKWHTDRGGPRCIEFTTDKTKYRCASTDDMFPGEDECQSLRQAS